MKRGFTLIEILLALLVLTIGVLAVVGLLSSTLDTNVKARGDLNIVSFADLALNHCHAIEDWNTLPSEGTLSLLDYDGNPITLQLGARNQYTSTSTLNDGTKIDRFTVTYQLDIQRSGDIKTIALQIWSGFNTTGSPRLFQTEIYNWNKS